MGTRRVAIVGIENSHAEEIVRYLNVEASVGVRVVALVAGETDRTTRLAALGSIDRVVESSTELLGEVDALIVTARDGADHRALAVPFLEAGTPVWVDKPLAASVADADAIIAAAQATLLTSSSTLRWLADTDAVASELAAIGDLQSVTVTGPADPTSAHSGLFFYGIHLADLAQRFVPGEPAHVDVQPLRHGIVARYDVDGVSVTLEFIRPDVDAQVPFHVTAVGLRGVVSRDIVIGADYVRPGVDAFVRMLDTATLPVSPAQMRASIAVLAEVARLTV